MEITIRVKKFDSVDTVVRDPEINATLELILLELKKINVRLDSMEVRIIKLETDMEVVKNDVAELKEKVDAIIDCPTIQKEIDPKFKKSTKSK